MWLVDISDWRARWREAAHALVSTCLGAVFVAMAVVTIEYEEAIAPSLDRFSQGWSNVASDLVRRLAEQQA